MKLTHHINKLTEPESELHGQFIRVVTDGSDQFVVSTLTQEVIIQPLSIRVTHDTCK